MWEKLPDQEKKEYKQLILAFASLTEMFAQKASDNDHAIVPIVNSKFQETAFQKAFNAIAEDIGNTSYDVFTQNSPIIPTFPQKSPLKPAAFIFKGEIYPHYYPLLPICPQKSPFYHNEFVCFLLKLISTII